MTTAVSFCCIASAQGIEAIKAAACFFFNKIIAPGTIPQLRSSEDLVRGAIFYFR